MNVKSVLIFDSGIGGLSIYLEINKLIPNQHIIYAFDNAAFPYGEQEDDVLVTRVCGMVSALCAEYNIVLVVIACNTASTLVLPYLRELLSIPVVGVVPAIKPAAEISQSKKIGLLATPATVKRAYTRQLVQDFAFSCEVTMVGSTRLVQMSESMLRGIAVDKDELQAVLSPFMGEVDCIVLGCTHFTLIKDKIEDVVGESCQVIDSSKSIANRVAGFLIKEGQKAFLNKHPHWVFSSASVNEEAVLNQEFCQIGFLSIQRVPIF
ncbi:glutamate racemase [Candidatus Enterovibrio escicola]|uniref:glutamate racemase n=1 Tax=Candidatus Enterovibrio escicola TaxID=1927127 RepID=UPI00123819AE|nr:glutamate racemase [Candidatus Enterovibrio escacola]